MRHWAATVMVTAVVMAACQSSSELDDSQRLPDQATLDEALREAAWANDVATASRLIEQGADVNAKDRTQQSAYLIATSGGYVELLQLALENGADVNANGFLQRHGVDQSCGERPQRSG